MCGLRAGRGHPQETHDHDLLRRQYTVRLEIGAALGPSKSGQMRRRLWVGNTPSLMGAAGQEPPFGPRAGLADCRHSPDGALEMEASTSPCLRRSPCAYTITVVMSLYGNSPIETDGSGPDLSAC